MFKCTEISEPWIGPVSSSSSCYSSLSLPLSARLPEISFNFILRHWQFTELQTQSLIAGQQLEIVLATDTDTETNSDTDTDTTCIAADTTATTFHCRPVESTQLYVQFYGRYVAATRSQTDAAWRQGMLRSHSPTSFHPDPALPLCYTVMLFPMSQQECLDYSQQEKTIFIYR